MTLVVDTSALVAIRRSEPEAPPLRRALGKADVIAMPASVYLEFCIVNRGDPLARAWLDDMLAELSIAIAPIDEATARLAADAPFGKEAGHRAGLNFGDCLSYAAAKRLDAALLYKGEDFAATDVETAA